MRQLVIALRRSITRAESDVGSPLPCRAVRSITDAMHLLGTVLHHIPQHLARAAGGDPAHPTPDSRDY